MTGAHLHDPRGKAAQGYLDLADNTSVAYGVRNTSSGPYVLAIDTTTGSDKIYSSCATLDLNYDDLAATAEAGAIRIFSSSGTVLYRNSITSRTTGEVAIESFSSTAGANVATVLNVGTVGATAPNSMNSSIVLHGVNDAATATTATISTSWETNQNREHLTIRGVEVLDFDMQSSSMIIGGGQHGTWTSLTDVVMIGHTSLSNTTSLASAVAIGKSASVTNSGTTAIGSNATCGEQNSISIGYSSATGQIDAICVAQGGSASGIASIVIGKGSSCSQTGAIQIGKGGVNDNAHTCVIGGNDASGYIDQIWFGRGYKSTTAQTDMTIRVTDADGGTTNGSNMVLVPGRGASSGTSGYFAVNTGIGSGGPPHTVAERFKIGAGATPDIRMRTHTDGGTFEGKRTNTEYVQTTDATVTTLWSYTLAEGESANFSISVNGSTTTDSLGSFFDVVARRDSGGSAAIVGASATAILAVTDAALVTAVIAVDASGNDVRVRLTGIAATTINWIMSVDHIHRGASA